MTTLCLTGWQQPADALCVIAPDAVHFDYSTFDTIEAVLGALPGNVDVVIGWSVGACIAMQAVASGRLHPRLLVLLSSKYQYMSNPDFPYGKSQEQRERTKSAYRENRMQAMADFQSLIAQGDRYENRIIPLLKDVPLWRRGGEWLDQIAEFSCAFMDFKGFPPTCIIHGAEDRVTSPKHSEYLHKAIPGSALHIFKGCAHAPHLHDPQALQEIIYGYGSAVRKEAGR